MAAAEYYLGTAAAQQLQAQRQPYMHPAPPPQQYPAPNPQYANPPRPQPAELHGSDLPPRYEQQHQIPPYAQAQAPGQAYPPPPPAKSQSWTQQQLPQPQQAYLTPPQHSSAVSTGFGKIRSHSQPPRVHFTPSTFSPSDTAGSDIETSSANSYSSGSDSETRPRRRRRHHSRSRSRSRSHYPHDRGHYRDHHRDDKDLSKEHKDRSTFLGAGAGGLIGDMIFPGLGTAAGLLLGGYGGRKHASKQVHSHERSLQGEDRSRRRGSEADADAHADRDAYHRSHEHPHPHQHQHPHHTHYEQGRKRDKLGSGWDARSGTFKMGSAVR